MPIEVVILMTLRVCDSVCGAQTVYISADYSRISCQLFPIIAISALKFVRVAYGFRV